MLTEQPKIGSLADGQAFSLGNGVSRIKLGIDKVTHQTIDFARIETGDGDVEVDFGQKNRKLAKFSRKNLSIYTRVVRDLIVSECERALLDVAQAG
jgi:hypothetical protein